MKNSEDGQPENPQDLVPVELPLRVLQLARTALELQSGVVRGKSPGIADELVESAAVIWRASAMCRLSLTASERLLAIAEQGTQERLTVAELASLMALIAHNRAQIERVDALLREGTGDYWAALRSKLDRMHDTAPEVTDED